MAQLAPVPKMQFWGTTGRFQGKPLAGGKLYTCIAGGTIADPKPTFTDYSGMTANTNPIILDINGMANLWISGYYKFFLYDANDVLQYSVDNVSASTGGGGGETTIAGLWRTLALSPTYHSDTTFTTAGNVASEFSQGQRIKATLASRDIYGTIAASSYAASGDITTVTTIWDSATLDDTLKTIGLSLIVQDPSPLPIVPPKQLVSNYTVTIADINQDLLFYALEDCTVTLPAASTMPAGTYFRIKNLGAATLKLDAYINGVPGTKLGMMDEVFVYSDSRNWLGMFAGINYPVELTPNTITIPYWRLNRTYVVTAPSITLPDASLVNSGNTLKIFCNTSSLTVYGTVNGSTNPQLGRYQALDLFTDGSAWYGPVISSSGSSTVTGNVRWNYIDGLRLSNNTDNSHAMDICGGSAVDSTKATILNSPTVITKIVNSAWKAGTNSGGIDVVPSSFASLMLYAYVIDTKNKDSVDILFSQSSSAPTLPAGFLYYRLIGAVKLDSSGTPYSGIFDGDYFYYANSDVLVPTYTFSYGKTTQDKITVSAVPAKAIGILQVLYAINTVGTAPQDACRINCLTGPTGLSVGSGTQYDGVFYVSRNAMGASPSYTPLYIVKDKLIPVDSDGKIAVYGSNGSNNLDVVVSIKVLGWIMPRDSYSLSAGGGGGGEEPGTESGYYVRATGATDAGDGTSYDKAWNGFAKIDWSKLIGGTTLYLCGTFVSTLVVPNNGTSETSRITIRGDSQHEKGYIEVSTGEAITCTGKSYLTFDGITINKAPANGIGMQETQYVRVANCTFSQIGTKGGTNFGIDGRYAQAMDIYNCRMTNEKGSFYATGIVTGIGKTGTLLTSTVDKCYISGITVDGIVTGNDTVVARCTVAGLTDMDAHADGIVVQGSRVIIKQNQVSDCTQCIYIDSFDMGEGAVCTCDDVVVCNNLVYQTAGIAHQNAIIADCETVGSASIKNLKIYNNTVVCTDQYGIFVTERNHGGDRLTGLQIFNNLVVDCGDYSHTGNICLYPKTTIPGLAMNNNLVGQYKQKGEPNYLYQGSPKTLSEMQALGFESKSKANPTATIFSSYTYQYSSNSFTLAKNSPAIGMGTNLGAAYAADITGKTRGSTWDVGCYQKT